MEKVANSEPLVRRLKKFLDYKKLGVSQLSEELGYANPEKLYRLYRVEGAKPSADIILDVSNKFVDELSVSWWITGIGDMILPQKKDQLKKGVFPQIVVTDKVGEEKIVMMDSKAAAGFPAHIDDADFYSRLPTMALPQVSNQSGTFICVQITGDSMSPTIQHDQWVVARYEEEFENIRGGDICLVVTETNGVICKRIYPNKKTGGIECVSDNEQYTAFELQRGQYQQLYKFTCSISFTAPGEPASELRKEIKKFEKRISVIEKKLNL